MFHIKPKREKKIIDELTKKFELRKNIINQEISIRDIYIYHPSNKSHGEVTAINNTYNSPPLPRLIAHFKSLLQIANEYHKKYYCIKNSEDVYVSKKDSENKITRVLTGVFSFYTTKFLTMKMLATIFEKLILEVKDIQLNVHLLISSVSVIIGKRVLNMSFYIQGGPDLKIHSLCKSTVSGVDVTYPNTTNFTTQDLGDPNINISEFISNFDKINNTNTLIPTGGVLRIHTMGGAEATVAIDICSDNERNQAKILVNKIIDRDFSQDTLLIPDQIDQILSSNTVTLTESSKIIQSVTHIDPDKDLATLMENDTMTEAELNRIKIESFDKMSIQKTSSGFLVKNPPFGQDYNIVATDERKLETFQSDFKERINKKNEEIKNQTIQKTLRDLVDAQKFVPSKKSL